MEPKKKILIVEDEGIVARHIQQSLEDSGYEITATLASGEDAVERVREQTPDLVLMDIRLKGSMDGVEAAGQVKKFSDTPIVYLTAQMDETLLERLKATEPSGYILKPFDEKELEAAIEIALEKFRLDRRRKQNFESQKMEGIGRLAGGIAHGFNNLLMIIKGFTEVLLESSANAQNRTELEEILKASNRAEDLTRQLLLFSRRQVLQGKIFNLNTLIQNLQGSLQRLIGDSYQIIMQLSPEPSTVEADPLLLEQTLVNLVMNARDAMPQGGTILIQTQNILFQEKDSTKPLHLKSGLHVMMNVSDHGCGMDETVQERLFEPFFTTKEQGKGVGLGLSTVYGAIRQSQGHISVTSQPGKGSIFTIYLPLLDKPSAFPNGHTGGVERGEASIHESRNILIVEDEPAIRELAAYFLRSEGHVILEAANGIEALKVIAAHPALAIHVLVTDVNMPEMGGEELEKQFRQIYPSSKVIFMSGYVESDTFFERLQKNQDGFLKKPFLRSELLRLLRQVLEPSGERK